jgi:hypothetical protein
MILKFYFNKGVLFPALIVSITFALLSGAATHRHQRHHPSRLKRLRLLQAVN